MNSFFVSEGSLSALKYLCCMEKVMTYKRLLFGIPLILLCVFTLFIISAVSTNFSQYSGLSLAVTIDFVLVIPFIYFLTIRSTAIPKITCVPFLILCMFLCGLALPNNQQWYLNGFEHWVFPVIELGVISIILWKLRKITLKFKATKSQKLDFFSALKTACAEVLPKAIVVPFATEIAVFYYGFVTWKRRPLAANEFSYHKESGTITLLIAVIGIVAIEMVTVHVLLSKWSTVLAWILTIASAYTAVQLFGFAKAVSRRLITIEGEVLTLRYSFLKEAEIPLDCIKNVRIEKGDLDPKEKWEKLSLLHHLEGHNVVIELHEPAVLHGMYGTKREFTRMALFVDEKEKFLEQLDSRN